MAFEDSHRGAPSDTAAIESDSDQGECDHTDTALLGSPEDGRSEPWPVLYDEEPRSGLRQRTTCLDCGETVEVYYRIEEIVDGSRDGDPIWTRADLENQD